MSQNSRLFIAGSLGMIKKFFYTIFKFNCPIRLQFLCQCFENIFLIINLIRLTKIHFEKKHYQTCWFEYFSICLVWICKLMYDNRGHSRTTLTQFCHFWPPPPAWMVFYPGCEKNRHFLTPTHLVHVVIECPLRDVHKRQTLLYKSADITNVIN